MSALTSPTNRLLMGLMLVMWLGLAGTGRIRAESVSKPAVHLYVDPSTMDWQPVEGVENATWKPLREDPHTGAVTALVRFPKGHVEPPHHHTHGHTVIVVSGEKVVTNQSLNQVYPMKEGDLLYTPATTVHTVRYVTDCTFLFITDGPFDLFWDEKPAGEGGE